MALATATITYDLADLLGQEYWRSSAKASIKVTTNIPGDTIVDTSGNQIRLGSATQNIGPDGTGSLAVWVPGAGSNPASWQYTFHVAYPTRTSHATKGDKSFGPFTITADANLADLVAEMPVQPEYASDVLDRLDALEAVSDGGGSGSLIVVGSGAIDLDNTKPNGYLIGYRFTGSVLVEGAAFGVGSYVFERDSTVTSGWTYRELADPLNLVVGPADTTPPVAGTLASSSVTSTGATVTATGASDAVSLASSPYSFSKDNGSTWTAYQSSNIYAWTGLTGSTAYQMRHRVKDAAGNVTNGTAITVTTSAPPPVEPTWTVTDTFTAADGTSLSGRTTPTGGKTYLTPGVYETQGDNAIGSITSNAVAATDGTNKGAAVTMTTANVAAEITYDLTAGGGSSGVRAVLWVNTNVETDALVLHLRGNGGLHLFRGGGVDVTLTGATTGVATSGTLRMSIQSNVVTIVSSAGTATATVATGTGYTGTGRRLGFAAGGAGAKVDNFKAAEL